MKINRFFSFSCACLLLIGLSYQDKSSAQNSLNNKIIAQNTNKNDDLILENKSQEMINFLFTGKFDSISNFLTPSLRSEISKDFLQNMINDVLKDNGKFQKLTDSKVVDTPGSDLVILTLNFENKTEDWIIIFNDKQEVIGIDIPSNKDIETIATEFINSLVNNDSVKARSFLHPFLKETIFPQQVASRWENFVKEKGDFKSISNMRIRKGSAIDDTDVVVMTLEFSQAKQQVFIIFDSSKNITGVDFIQ